MFELGFLTISVSIPHRIFLNSYSGATVAVLGFVSIPHRIFLNGFVYFRLKDVVFVVSIPHRIFLNGFLAFLSPTQQVLCFHPS